MRCECLSYVNGLAVRGAVFVIIARWEGLAMVCLREDSTYFFCTSKLYKTPCLYNMFLLNMLLLIEFSLYILYIFNN